MDVIGAALDHLVAFVAQWWILIALLAGVFYVGRVLSVGAPAPGRAALPRAAAPTLRTRPTLVCAIVFVVALLWIASPVLVRGLPLPWMHDDYSCLLGAEMVTQGHTSMPPHPMWRHFETMHQLQVPRRASKYQPGQLLVLAAGIRLVGHAIAGEWLITALAAAAICWAAFAWVDAGIALLIGLGAAIHPTLLEWGEAYRGGGLAAFAGALVIGSTARLRRTSRVRDGCVFGAGVVLLAISRPYEGAVLTIICAAILVRRIRLRAALIAILVIAIGMAGVGLWNWSVTGKPLRMPYMEYERQYVGVPLFIFQTPTPQPILNREMSTAYSVYLGQYHRAREHPVVELQKKAADMAGAAFGSPSSRLMAKVWPLFLLSFAGLWPLLRRDASARRLTLIAASGVAALLLLEGWLLPQYFAPAYPAAWIVLVWSAVTLPSMFSHRRGAALLLLIALLYVVNACGAWWQWASDRGQYFERDRRAIEQSLRADGRRDLILVPPDVFDVVYNHSDIDAQDVVWARDLGPDANRSLVRYYSDRMVWMLSRGAGGRFLVTRIQNSDGTGSLH
jgi:hypothetical protein